MRTVIPTLPYLTLTDTSNTSAPWYNMSRSYLVEALPMHDRAAKYVTLHMMVVMALEDSVLVVVQGQKVDMQIETNEIKRLQGLVETRNNECVLRWCIL